MSSIRNLINWIQQQSSISNKPSQLLVTFESIRASFLVCCSSIQLLNCAKTFRNWNWTKPEWISPELIKLICKLLIYFKLQFSLTSVFNKFTVIIIKNKPIKFKPLINKLQQINQTSEFSEFEPEFGLIWFVDWLKLACFILRMGYWLQPILEINQTSSIFFIDYVCWFRY